MVIDWTNNALIKIKQRKPPPTLCQFSLSSNLKESFIRILDPDANSDHHQNLTIPKLGQIQSPLKILAKTASNFVYNIADKPINPFVLELIYDLPSK